METLRLGSVGPLVTRWQTFLRGLDLYEEEAHGRFDIETQSATKAYQSSRGLKPVDGIAGNGTLGKAMTEGFSAVDDSGYDDFDKDGPNWPPVPDDLKAPDLATRQRLFGAFSYVAAPLPGNPEAIQIKGSWAKDNITTVVVPQLKDVPGVGSSGKVAFHKALVPQLLGLFQAWEDAGLLHLIKGCGGTWAPRFIRGSRTNLSDHAWGSAIDLNVPWNGLGVRPALVGQTGSVRELVPLANKFGAFWGGHYKTRLDGMHFGFAKVLTPEELEQAGK